MAKYTVTLKLRLGEKTYTIEADNPSNALIEAKRIHRESTQRAVKEIAYWQDIPFPHEVTESADDNEVT